MYNISKISLTYPLESTGILNIFENTLLQTFTNLREKNCYCINLQTIHIKLHYSHAFSFIMKTTFQKYKETYC